MMRFVFRFVSLAVLLISSAHAYDGRVATPASVESVKQLFRLSALDKLLIDSIRRGVEAGNRASPEQAVDTNFFLSFATPEALADHFAPIYANYLSHDYAVKLIAAYQTPAGKEVAKLAVLEAESGRPAVKAELGKLSPAMKEAVNDFHRSVTYTSLINAYEKSQGEVRAAFRKWESEVMKERMAQVNRELAAVLEEDMSEGQADDGDAAQPVEVPPLPEKLSARTGLYYFDDEARSLFISYRQNADLNRQMRGAMKGLKLDDILKAEYLSSRDGIEAANLRLLALDGVLVDYDKISDKILDNYNKNISRIKMPAEERKALEEGNAKNFAVIIDEQIRENELRRTLIELVKRTISFCESRLDKIKYEDGKLLFYESSDLDTYRDLVAQINKQVEETRKLDDEELARRKKTIERMNAS